LTQAILFDSFPVMKNILLHQGESYKIGISSDLSLFYLITSPENDWIILGQRLRNNRWEWEMDYPHNPQLNKCENLWDALDYFSSLSEMEKIKIALLFDGLQCLDSGIRAKEISLFGMLTEDNPRQRLEKILSDQGEEFDLSVVKFGDSLFVEKSVLTPTRFPSSLIHE